MANVTQQTDLGITVGQLQDFPSYKKDVSAKKNAVLLSIKQEGTHCTCNSVALTLIILVAAAGGGTLIAYSGGPNNLTIFMPGVAFNLLALTFAIWLIVIVVRTIQHQKAQELELADVTALKVDNLAILEEMQKPETQVEHLHLALSNLSPEQRQSYMSWVDQHYFGPGKPPLNQEQQKVLSSFAAYPEEIRKLDLTKADPVFAGAILSHLDPKILEETNKQGLPVGRNLLETLFTRLGPSDNVANHPIYARHPHYVVSLLQTLNQTKEGDGKQILNPVMANEDVISIYNHMGAEQKIQFFKKLHQDCAALAALKESGKLTSIQTQQLTTIRTLIRLCIKETLNEEFVGKFALNRPEQNLTEQAKAAFELDKELLAQMALWQPQLAFTLFCESISCMENTGFMGALKDALNQIGGRATTTFVKTVSQAFTQPVGNQQLAKKNMQALLTTYAANNQELPELIQKVYASVPELMAAVVPGLNQPATNIAIKVVNEYMTKEQQLLFLEAEEKENSKSFRNRFDSLLKRTAQLPEERSSALKDSLITAYLVKFPEKFKSLILENKCLGNARAKGLMALDILDHMDKIADTVIAEMDKGSVGYCYFNLLTNLLLEQIIHEPSLLRGKLIARFHKSQKMADSLKSPPMVASTDPLFWFNKKADWEKFRQIANKY